MRVEKRWNKLPREVVDMSSLGRVQGQARWSSEQPDLVKVSLPTAGALELLFYDSMSL